MGPFAMEQWRENVRAECAARGLAETKRLLAENRIGARKRPIVQAWVDELEAPIAAAALAAEKEIDRSIAREANEIARRANRIALLAGVLAALALAVAIYAALREFPISH